MRSMSQINVWIVAKGALTTTITHHPYPQYAALQLFDFDFTTKLKSHLSCPVKVEKSVTDENTITEIMRAWKIARSCHCAIVAKKNK
jgi:hypothetical protein